MTIWYQNSPFTSSHKGHKEIIAFGEFKMYLMLAQSQTYLLLAIIFRISRLKDCMVNPLNKMDLWFVWDLNASNDVSLLFLSIFLCTSSSTIFISLDWTKIFFVLQKIFLFLNTVKNIINNPAAAHTYEQKKECWKSTIKLQLASPTLSRLHFSCPAPSAAQLSCPPDGPEGVLALSSLTYKYILRPSVRWWPRPSPWVPDLPFQTHYRIKWINSYY